MARRVFFSFHYEDVVDFRVNVVRNHWVTKLNRDAAGFFDASVWEKARKTSDLAIKRLINGALKGTSRTAVLIGSHTANRRWVRYEVFRSLSQGNNVIGVHVNGIKGKNTGTKPNGTSPFAVLGLHFGDDGKTATPCYKSSGSWHIFDDHGPYTLHRNAPLQQRGKVHSLSALGLQTYDWAKDAGYENFAGWVA